VRERERERKQTRNKTDTNKPEGFLSFLVKPQTRSEPFHHNTGLKQQKTKLTKREHRFVLKTEQKKRRKINRNRDAGKEYNVKSRRSKKKFEGRSVVLSNHAQIPYKRTR
jgi:hypothetical protein